VTSPGVRGSGAGGGVSFLDRHREGVDRALSQVAAEAVEGLRSPLGPAVEYALSTSGKRLRPVLCIAAYSAARGVVDVPEAVYRLSCALEIVHTYSLVHDDLPSMDDDDLRRGRPTLHRVFGGPLAIVAGAALLPLAVATLSRNSSELGLSPEERGQLVIELATAAGAEGMVGGQLLDLEGEHGGVTPETLEDIHRRKTGALLTSSLRIGALAGRAQSDLLEALTRYGGALGLAFQIADDLLDVEGSSADLGKTAGRDVALRKASYPSIYGVEEAKSLSREMISQAKEALEGYDLPHLIALADFVVDRRS